MANNSTDAEILFPNREITVGDDVITVREFSAEEDLRYGSRCRGLLAAIEKVFADGEDASFDDVVEDYADEWLSLISVATGKAREWVGSLTRAQLDAIGVVMWKVNERFFLPKMARRRVLRERTKLA